MSNAFSRRGFSRALFAGMAAVAAQPTFAAVRPSLAHALSSEMRTRFDLERIGPRQNRQFQVQLFAMNTTKRPLRVPVWGSLLVEFPDHETLGLELISQATMRELMSRIGPRVTGPQEIALPPVQERLIATYSFSVPPALGDQVLVSMTMRQREQVGIGGGLGSLGIREPQRAPAGPPRVREGALHGANYQTTLTLNG